MTSCSKEFVQRWLIASKDPSHFLFSGFVYCYLENPFLSYTVNILNVSYYLTIERDLVQVGLMSKDPSSLHCATLNHFIALESQSSHRKQITLSHESPV